MKGSIMPMIRSMTNVKMKAMSWFRVTQEAKTPTAT